MPGLTVVRDKLFEKLGRVYTDEAFDELCFSFGIELDDVTSEKIQQERERGVAAADASDEVLYRIDLPANRYDLVSLEGLARALRVFLELDPVPSYKVITPEHVQTMFVEPETSAIRPFVVCAILRDVSFDAANYKSFMDLQDKLHMNICRKRTLVAIGTHDLDTIQGPFRYCAEAPEDIRFVPLGKDVEVNGHELMTLYEGEKHIKPFLSIIRDAPRYPVIRDAAGRVLSLPPIINGNHSKITLATRNVLVECTATDHTKAAVVLNQVVTTFSAYCAAPFTVEAMRVVYPDARYPVDPSNQAPMYPSLDDVVFTTSVADVNRTVGISLDPDAALRLLNKMMLRGELGADRNSLTVSVPPTRADVLASCDIVEDIAIAYGFNNIVRTLPKCSTVGKQLPINKLTDLLRLELAMAGFTEVLTFSLCSKEDAFTRMRRVDDGQTAVVIANPKGVDFELARPNLLTGLLKTLAENKTHTMPLRIFEVSDVVLKTAETDVGAKNVRRLAVAHIDTDTAGFEIVHGVLDRVMDVLAVPFVAGTTTPRAGAYSIAAGADPALFPGLQATVYYSGRAIGCLGVVHPEVLQAFGIVKPVAVLEIDIEPFLVARTAA